MPSEVDLSQLAVDRSEPSPSRGGDLWSLVTRFALPAMLLAGVAALALWAAWGLLFPAQEVTVVPVHATRTEVRRAGTQLFNAAGWVEPRPTPIRVAALAGGFVEELLVVENQPVEAGEPVAKLIDEDAQLAQQRAQAELDLRGAELQQAYAGEVASRTRFQQPVHLQAPLDQAKAELARVETKLQNLPFTIDAARAQLKFAQSDYQGKLASQGVVADRIIDQAASALDEAQARFDELQQEAKSLESEKQSLLARRNALQTTLELKADEQQALDETRAKVFAANARVADAKAALEEAELRLRRMTVRAPVDGRILRLVAYPGAQLAGGMSAAPGADGGTVVTMYQPDRLQVRVDVRFEDIPKVTLGQPVLIDSPAIDAPVRGRVLYVSSEADIQKNTLQVKAAVDDPPKVFKPEMLVDVAFLAPQQKEGGQPASEEELRLLIPKSLVHRDGETPYVWVADQSENVARKVNVELTPAAGDMVEAAKGLSVSSRVIASGSENLTDGARIRVTGEEAPTEAEPSGGQP